MIESLFGRVIFTIFSLAVALIPTWFFLGGRSLLEPDGFLENFFILGVGVYVLGSIQLALMFIWAGGMFVIWVDPDKNFP